MSSPQRCRLCGVELTPNASFAGWVLYAADNDCPFDGDEYTVETEKAEAWEEGRVGCVRAFLAKSKSHTPYTLENEDA